MAVPESQRVSFDPGHATVSSPDKKYWQECIAIMFAMMLSTSIDTAQIPFLL